MKDQLAVQAVPRWTLPAQPMSEQWIERNHTRFYAAVDLEHRDGESIKDDETRNGSGSAWRFGGDVKTPGTIASKLKFEHAIFGPYDDLGQFGLYRAYFRIKIDSNTSPHNVLFIDVTSEGSPQPANTKGSLFLRGQDFSSPGKYELFAVPFAYNEELDLEYRVHQEKAGVSFTCDYIAVVQCQREEEAQTSTE